MQEIIDGQFIDLPEDDGGEPRCAVVLLLDTSTSMSGEPIAQLNDGLRMFREALQEDDLSARRCEVAVVTFGGSVRVIQDFTVASNMPQLPTLSANGGTPMGEAIIKGTELVATKKSAYRNEGRAQYRPWIFMITDGGPTDLERIAEATAKVHQGDSNKSFLFFAVGCYAADMQRLKDIAPPGTPPIYLSGADFKAMFKWVSDSLGRVSSSKVGQQTALAPLGNWGTIKA